MTVNGKATAGARAGPLLLLPLLLLLTCSPALAATPISPANVLFGHAIKNGGLAPYPAETTSFEHNCSAPPCVITHINVPSIYPQQSCPWDWENGRLRVYVDGAATPSVDITLLQLSSVGTLAASGNNLSPQAPFGNDLFGKTALTGGVYSTMRIPFGKSIRTAIVAPASCNVTQIFWFVVRGVEALPVTVGDFVVSWKGTNCFALHHGAQPLIVYRFAAPLPAGFVAAAAARPSAAHRVAQHERDAAAQPGVLGGIRARHHRGLDCALLL